jgi:hypothetical protein
MTPIARQTRSETITVRTPSLQRPGRRTFSLAAGLAPMLVLVDAIFHPGPLTDLWTVRTVQELSALMLYPVVGIVLAAITYGLRGLRRARTSGMVTASTPIRLSRPRLQLVDTPEFSSRAA